jgi:hypothetical protein
MHGTATLKTHLGSWETLATVTNDVHRQDGFMVQSSLAAGPNEEGEPDKPFGVTESAYASKQVHCRIWLSGAQSSM